MHLSTGKKIILGGLALGLAIGAAFWTGSKAMADKSLSVGDQAPDFTLPNQDNKPITLSDLKGKVVLLAFYPADFTKGCTFEAHSLTAANKDLLTRGVQVFGVSVQDATSHSKFCHQEGIPYTLLADTKHTVSEQYSGLYPGIGLAKRVTFIIGKDGKIVYIDSNVNRHIQTCGADWVTWLDQHPEVTK
jgi:peroxiredoxin Q/BCP